MAAGKEQYIAVQGLQPSDDAVGAAANLGWAFAARAAIAEKLPVRPLFQNSSGFLSLVGAVVPLDQVRVDYGDLAEAGQLTGAPRPLQWASQDMREI